MRNEFEPIIRGLKLLTAERTKLSESGPRFTVIHRFWQPETDCTPGEVIGEIQLHYRGSKTSVPLSLRLMLLFDYLARHKRIGQNAAQIAAGLSGDRFTRQHGAHATKRKTLQRDFSRTAVKQQISRLRAGLRRAFRGAGLRMSPDRVLLSETTTMNEVRYRLRVVVTWEHNRA